MDFLSDIKSDTIIICNNDIKKEIIKLNMLLPIKFMTLSQFRHKYLFDYDENAIIFIMNEYRVKYEVAKMYIDNLYYIDIKHYGISKLDFLSDMKQKLIDNKLLIYDEVFKHYLSRCKIIIYDTCLDKFHLNIFKNLNYIIIDYKYNNYEPNIYKFDSMEDEVYYVANKIASLIVAGVSPDNIKLTNVDSGYYTTIERIFGLFNLKVNISYKSMLGSFPLIKKFIANYIETDDIMASLDGLDNKSVIYNELINIINRYAKYDNKDLLIYKVKYSSISSYKYSNAIEIIDYLNYVSNDDDYIFMLGFNEGIIPNYYRDINYLSDDIAPILGLYTTRELNVMLKARILKCICDIKNLVITFKLRDTKKTYYESTLTNRFKILTPDVNSFVSYSQVYDKIRLVRAFDNYFRYGSKSADFDILNNHYSLIYNSYDNRFKGIKNQMSKLFLSYSKMNIYNKCNFRYYVANVLKLDTFPDNFSAYIGSLVHFVLEKCLCNQDYDIHKYVKLFMGDKVLTNKENFFLNKYVAAIDNMLKQILLEKEYGSFDNAMYEEKVDVDYGDNIHFLGVIDKLLYYQYEGKTYVAIIDYKTGADDISLDYLSSGINIQLPVYLYLASNINFKNVIFTGFYLQRFDIINDDYRLYGYSNSDSFILSIQDNNYHNSKIIKGLKTNKDGSFSRYSRVLSSDDITQIIDKVKIVIDNTIRAIKNNEFAINPKVIDGHNVGCEYCKFKDICFKTIKDEVIITKD